MEFLTYKKFTEQDQVNTLIKLLEENTIEFKTAEDRESLDSLYGNNHFSHHYYIKIRQKDFAKVDSLLLEINERELDTVDKDHYLYEFNDDELFDLLSKPDEWNELDYQLAKRILRERGKDVSSDIIQLLKAQRLNELAKPEESAKTWIYAVYIFSLLGGLIGIFLGISLSTDKKTLPDGRRVYTYSQEDRTHGNRIVIIGIVMFLVILIADVLS